MDKIVQAVRACLAVGAVSLLCQVSEPALADNFCSRGWHAKAEKTAELGLRLLHSYRAADRVRLWRMIELGEDVPSGSNDEQDSGSWGGGWRDEKKASEFLATEAANRGVAWSLPQDRVYWQASLNLSFAAKIFEERRALLGDQHPYLKQWLENQRAVFAKTSPDLVNASGRYTGLAATLAADDYQYQLAALVFYGQSYADAVERFRAIAAQPASRYRSIAAYMVARSLARAGRVGEALAEVSAIEGNPELADVRAIAQQLVGTIAWDGWWRRNRSAAQNDAPYRLLVSNAQAMRLPVIELQSDLSKRAQYWQVVNDLGFFLRSDGARSWLRRQFDEDWWLDPARAQQSGYWSPAVARVAADDELIDWLQSTEQVRELAGGPWLVYWSSRTSSSAYAAASEHVSRRAEESGKLIWLLAEAMRSPDSSRILGAISQITDKLPDCAASQGELLALGALRFHKARDQAIREASYWSSFNGSSWNEWLQDLDRDARREATRLILPLTGSATALPSERTDDAALDQLLSTGLDAFMTVRDQYRYELTDGKIAVLNMLPARVLLQLAEDETIAQDLRAAIVRTAWTRAYLLGDRAVLDPATDLLGKLNPGLSEMVVRYRTAWTETGRKGAALTLLVRAPSMQVFIPNVNDGFRYRSREIRPGAWSWYLSDAESAKEAISLFWADDWNLNDGNWWCRPDVVRLQANLERNFYDKPLAMAYDESWYSYYDPQGFIAYPTSLRQRLDDRRRDFLGSHPVMNLVDWEELGRLAKIPAAPQYLSDEVTAWVRDSSWLDRWLYGDGMAEALALSVRATRFGCRRDGPNRAYSYAAFSLLHEFFPESEAARHTRYWYN
jgi:hypothetical protein